MRINKKPEVGQLIFVVPIHNRRHEEPGMWEVLKVGRKYFTAKRLGRSHPDQFYIDGWHEYIPNYTGNYQAYESEQQYLDERKESELRRKIRKEFDFGGRSGRLSLDALRKIDTIIKEDLK